MSDSDSLPPIPAKSLRERTTHGLMWVVAQAVVSRGITIVQQLALAWLLAKSDFGLIGLTYSVTTLVTLMANPGIDTILVQRLRYFHHWATPAFWLGLATGAAASLLMLALGPIAARVYEQPELAGLIAVLAISTPIQALQIVPKAQLQSQMRFRALVLLGLLQSLLTASLTIAAAWFGMGAYSFVAPVPICTAIVVAANWWLARPHVRLWPEFSRWKYLIGNSATVGAAKLLGTFNNQADYIALGLAGLSDATIGTYVFAFSVAIQSLRLLSSNVSTVLLPGLSHMAFDPEKQVRATLRAMRLLALVAIPFCILQILLSAPVFRLLFPPRWFDAVLPCQILTLGLMFSAVIWPATSLLLAQGRFREWLHVVIIGTIVIIILLGVATWLRPSIVSIAVAISLWHMLNSPFLHWATTRKYAPASSYFQETYRPFAASVVSAGPCVLLQQVIPATQSGNVVAIVASTLVFSTLYVVTIFLISRTAFDDLIQQLAPYWPFRRRYNAHA